MATAATVSAFACSMRGAGWGESIIHARSRGQAKREYFDQVRDAWPDVSYLDVRARCVGAPQSSERFRRCAEYRGVPFARVGMRVSVGGVLGVIVGHNASANFDVLFDADSRYAGAVLNCHPCDRMIFCVEEPQ